MISGEFAGIDAQWLDAMEYPTSGEEVAALYAVGYSLVEFLIDRAGPRQLFAFQCDERPPSEKLASGRSR